MEYKIHYKNVYNMFNNIKSSDSKSTDYNILIYSVI